MAKKKNPIVLIYILLGYILLQFFWWVVHMNQLTQEINKKGGDLSVEMVFAEGFVFLVLLLIGFGFTIKAFKKELKFTRQQNNFLLAITHELKTPLSSIKLFFQTLKRPELPANKKEQLIERGVNDVDRLNLMIENLLLSARFEGDALNLQTEKINLSELIHKIVDKARVSFAADHPLESNIPEAVHLNTDEQALETILINLLENACKYSDEGKLITIRLVEKESEVTIEVKDQGIGIAKENRTEIFNKFFRIQNEETRSTKGTGLGLYIVKHLIKMLGGRIFVEENTPQGTKFVITLSK